MGDEGIRASGTSRRNLLALALGAGAEMRAPMARAVIGGLITSTLLTLLVVPVFYTLLDDARARDVAARHNRTP